MNSNRFSPSEISNLRNSALNSVSRHERFASPIDAEVQILDRLLAGHLAGVPDTTSELATVGQRLPSLLETGGPAR